MIRHWRGRLGTEYAIRDKPRIPERKDVFEKLDMLGYPSVLEVGCNHGNNLDALSSGRTVGVEPNQFARRIARQGGHEVIDGVCHNLPFDDREFDLVLTAGVLIHVPPRKLDRSIRELIRVTRGTLLCLEYIGDDEVIPYRGHRKGIWKRDYGGEILKRADGPVRMDVTPEAFLRDTPFEGCTAWKMTRL